MSELSVLIFRQVLKTVHSLSQRHKGKDLRLRFQCFKNTTRAVQRTGCLNQGGVRLSEAPVGAGSVNWRNRIVKVYSVGHKELCMTC